MDHTVVIRVTVVSMLSLVYAFASLLPAYAQRLVAREVSLGRKEPGEIQYSAALSPNRRRIAFAAKVNEGEAVFVDGVAGPAFTQIARYPLTEGGVQNQIIFSPDSRRVAYVAKRGQKFLVVVDNKAQAEFDDIRVGAPMFSQDSRRIAYEAKREGKWYVVVDGAEGKPFDAVTEVRFSPDSRLIFDAKRGDKWYIVTESGEIAREEYRGESKGTVEGGADIFTLNQGDRWYVVVDGVMSKPYDSLGNNIEVSADRKHVLYQAEAEGKSFVVLNGKEGTKYDSVEENSYKLSTDGRRVAYIARDVDRLGDKYVAVVDGQESKPYDHVSEPSFSPDGKHVAYVGSTFKPERQGLAHAVAVIDGIEGEKFERVGPLFHFSPDGSRVAYIAERGGKSMLVVDGRNFVYDKIIDLTFSQDGRRLMLVAQRGARRVLVLDGNELKYEPSRDEPATVRTYDSHEDELAFSTDGKRTAFVASLDGKEVAIIDGVAGKPYEDIDDLQFTADGAHVIYTAARGSKTVVVVDGVESKEYDEILDKTFRLEDENTLGFLAIRSQETFRVALDIEK